ncbi:GNAT family N-acetyltransferase [Pleionea mediterranea]|uniref:Ribosomal protein S18 acetylase RimI-like enzyme n=1 Tax=Pleionea mediterranea TaxID=523701 RepID=A0A316FT05_9GAMM|nr:GNAT family N-acetyltransferase [Pleionea mediterranea]PWK50750.1 ribosomal protein S18 acetylase RimI-like enzyme [Pleionea mediterranea]
MTIKNWTQKVSLRKFSTDDIPFMRSLYASTRESELAMTNFTSEEKKQFITQQFNAQLSHYTQYYCSDAFYIIEYQGKSVGRLFVDYWKNEIRVVDIALMPDYRNLELGSYYFTQLFEEARQSNRTVTIHVEHNNPAKQLYERLGFKLKTQTNDIYLLMEWCP